MQLTKIHIFLILLVALVLCSTLGICYGQEGYTNRSDDIRNYKSYSDYITQLNDDTIRSINIADGRSSNYNNPFYNKARWHHDNTEKGSDLNSGDDSDSSGMNTGKNKYSNYYREDDIRNHNRINDRLGIFDSVAKGQMNGSMYNIKEEIINQSDSQGIPRSGIPKGQENLYILKSEVVPPVCPACPSLNCNNSSSSSGIDVKKCPPCPPCARCPEPAFECKKVPNYNSRGLMDQLPIPWASKL
jgi:hypothetical protein